MLSVRRVNLSDPAFNYDSDDPDGFRSGMLRFGPRLDAQETGASVYDKTEDVIVVRSSKVDYFHGETD